MEKTKRILAILMAVLMVATVFPMNVFAADASTPVTLNGTTFKQGDAVYADLYVPGNEGEWYGLYYADSTPASGTSIAWAYPSKLKSGANIACYTTWTMLDDNANADLNDENAFYYQDYNEVWHLSPGDYKFIYFSNGNYDSYDESKVAYFTVSYEESDNPYNPGITSDLKVNKSIFCVDEDILVTAKGFGDAWIGIHKVGDTPGEDNSYYWYYINKASNGIPAVSGEQCVLQSMATGKGSDFEFDASESIPAGNYVIRYFPNNGYDYIDELSKTITIKAHGEITESGIDKASFENEGAVKGICADCGVESVKSVIGKATAELKASAYEQTSDNTKAEVIVKDDKGNVLVENTDYTLAFANNSGLTSIDSKATVTITLNNDRYSGSTTLEYDIITPHTHTFTQNKKNIVKASFDMEGKIETICDQCPVVKDTTVIPAITAAELEALFI